MKKCVEMTVHSIQQVAFNTFEMTLKNTYIAQVAMPGQFLHLMAEGHTLRRPLSIADIDRRQETITILFKQIGQGTKQLADCREGMKLDAIGPAGYGFSYDKSMKTALLIGGGVGIPPLYFLGKELRRHGVHVKAVLGFQSEKHVFYEEKFQGMGETYVMTNDGSYGNRGFVTDGVDLSGTFVQYFSCGPIPMLQAITNKLKDHPGSISLEARLGCGVGACFACAIPANLEGGYRKICTDGPVFAAGEVVL
ncbi:dihydroorotate dehydrogenase electron transfer subunit [Lentibacillus salicampi]|uniref:Dihydroorotate dehydrogenase B (NAD(+)), electron transfer subunit n=1 Tax=Lentibacillus salicampi TaxID=175306 RepID=A0A4Y9AGP6_9BACI|nr:dihydroorotate dehydrogenase electron transfer subunit [Lentibacillus salicampi]TFJ94585.1 dihydroorotate dehydrogenase electron transfer subunit [Lentibacillus salicampi]